MNVIRAHLGEFGITIPKGIQNMGRVIEACERGSLSCPTTSTQMQSRTSPQSASRQFRVLAPSRPAPSSRRFRILQTSNVAEIYPRGLVSRPSRIRRAVKNAWDAFRKWGTDTCVVCCIWVRCHRSALADAVSPVTTGCEHHSAQKAQTGCHRPGQPNGPNALCPAEDRNRIRSGENRLTVKRATRPRREGKCIVR